MCRWPSAQPWRLVASFTPTSLLLQAGSEYVPQVHYLAGGKFTLKAGLAQCGQPIRQVAKLVDTLHDAIPNQDLSNILSMP